MTRTSCDLGRRRGGGTEEEVEGQEGAVTWAGEEEEVEGQEGAEWSLTDFDRPNQIFSFFFKYLREQ